MKGVVLSGVDVGRPLTSWHGRNRLCKGVQEVGGLSFVEQVGGNKLVLSWTGRTSCKCQAGVTWAIVDDRSGCQQNTGAESCCGTKTDGEGCTRIVW